MLAAGASHAGIECRSGCEARPARYTAPWDCVVAPTHAMLEASAAMPSMRTQGCSMGSSLPSGPSVATCSPSASAYAHTIGAPAPPAASQ